MPDPATTNPTATTADAQTTAAQRTDAQPRTHSTEAQTSGAAAPDTPDADLHGEDAEGAGASDGAGPPSEAAGTTAGRATWSSGGRRRVLLLGGTSEARALAGSLPEFTVITSLAGRTSSPLLPAGEVRIGGFGGVDGLVAYLRAHRIDVLVDATHPFAATISGNAARAASLARVPLVVLRRPGWTEQPGDGWHRVRDLGAAAALLPQLGRRVFLTTGRQGIAEFADVDAWFLARSVEPPEPPMPRRLEVLLDRGPFTLGGERKLLIEHRIDVLVSKDSGGADAKLVAARELGLPVVMVDRPPAAATAHTVASVAEAIEQLRGLCRAIPDDR